MYAVFTTALIKLLAHLENTAYFYPCLMAPFEDLNLAEVACSPGSIPSVWCPVWPVEQLHNTLLAHGG